MTASRRVRPLFPLSRCAGRLTLAALGLGLPSALAAVTPPTAAGVLAGTIVDWPSGTTGTLRLSDVDHPDLADAAIDESGRFSLQLPGPDAFSQTLAHTAELLIENSNFSVPEDNCKGQGTAKPDTSRFRYFNLDVLIGDQPPQELKLNTDARFPRPVGSVTSNVTYFDAPTTLEGTVTCSFGSTTYHGTFPAGWSLLKNVVTTGTTVAVLNKTVTSTPLPAALAWRLRDRFAGIGISFNTPKSGEAGFIIDSVTPLSPAALAGVKVNDLLVEVDGQDVTKLSRDAAYVLVRGGPSGAAVGSTVTLGVKRGSDPAILQFTMTRALIK